jgi:N-acetyl-anhydromuramyl-L-alanine amidase AmpD
MRDINKIIVHCTATPEGRDVSVDTIRQWHLDRGWSDIGYHYIIDLKGNLHEGRPIERQGAHVRGYNKGSIGITYVGGVDSKMKPKDTRTENQKGRLEALIMDLMDSYPNSTLHGHNEFSSKACPSFDVQKEYIEIIKYFKECES